MIEKFVSGKQAQVTALARELKREPQIEMPITEWFTPGMYIRQIHIPANTFVISEIHKTEHPFVISQGIAKVWTDELGAQFLYAPHTGITKPLTRRMLLTITDVIWTTFHATDLRDVEEIKKQILIRLDELPETQIEEIKETLCLM